MNKSIDKDSLERLVPDYADANDTLGQETLILHLERYKFATRFLPQGEGLDIACGVGYGTKLMIEKCGSRVTKITGVDLSKEAIDYAKERYKDPKIDFVVADASQYNHRGKKVDFLVSLETIEHIPEPQDLVKHFKSLLKPNGVLVASVPVTPSVDGNPYHVNDFTVKSFKKMFTDIGFTEIDYFPQDQPFNPFKVISKKDGRARDIRSNLPKYYLQNPYALYKRVASTLVDGFKNKYLTVAWRLKK
ncbi:MAG: class I SAM-dependent methyltransferase [Bernardetiaceae bacterium]|nr:class I SAM-dependent methyltransferase [Bernardetiaceae bacterium]